MLRKSSQRIRGGRHSGIPGALRLATAPKPVISGFKEGPCPQKYAGQQGGEPDADLRLPKVWDSHHMHSQGSTCVCTYTLTPDLHMHSQGSTCVHEHTHSHQISTCTQQETHVFMSTCTHTDTHTFFFNNMETLSRQQEHFRMLYPLFIHC